jgi:hypothetical protein
MNKYDLTQSGGFPLDQGVLNFLQECIKTASVSAALAGPLAILSGCVVTGNYMEAGFVSINGEILPFSPGVVSAKIVIEEVSTPVIFQDGTPKVVKFVRTARFGDDGTDNYPYLLFKRNTAEGLIKRIERLELLSAPLISGGSMMFWNKPFIQIPAGWREVENWRGRMPIGVNPDDLEFSGDPGKLGGSKTHTNTIDEMAPHSHTYADNQSTEGIDFGSGSTRGSKTQSAEATRTTNIAGGLAGVAQPYNIMNPYRTVYFIEPIPSALN